MHPPLMWKVELAAAEQHSSCFFGVKLLYDYGFSDARANITASRHGKYLKDLKCVLAATASYLGSVSRVWRKDSGHWEKRTSANREPSSGDPLSSHHLKTKIQKSKTAASYLGCLQGAEERFWTQGEAHFRQQAAI
jgi:hypothetical protein